ncbi:MAG: hypothetical protein LUD72_13820 [Bacteroidales bacterium]|nr:hypothetical protein [Bacteroidales bacterium]
MTAEWTATDGRTVQLWWGGAGSSPCYVQDSRGNAIRHGEWSVPGDLLDLLDMLNASDISYVLHARAEITRMLDGQSNVTIQNH